MNLEVTQTSGLKTIQDSELLMLTKAKAQKERSLTMEVIQLLQEIYDRRLHLKRGYSSLHQYCVKELRYSDGAAYRRIKAMKLTQEMPEVVKSIESGSLSLCTASQLQKAFESKASEKNPIPTEMKQALVAQVENQSRRQTEKVLVEICPKVIKRDEKITLVNSTQVKLELVIDQELLEKLERLKSLTSHKNKNLKELLNDLVDEALLRKDPLMKSVKNGKVTNTVKPPAPALGQSVNSRYIPARVRQEVWMRDRGQCTYFDRTTKRKCESNHRLQFEHIEAYSYGGKSTVQNMRLLCANHNALTAKTLGSRSL